VNIRKRLTFANRIFVSINLNCAGNCLNLRSRLLLCMNIVFINLILKGQNRLSGGRGTAPLLP